MRKVEENRTESAFSPDKQAEKSKRKDLRSLAKDLAREQIVCGASCKTEDIGRARLKEVPTLTSWENDLV